MKYIIITGGVISGIGKGVTTSSIGVLLQKAGYKVTAIKMDPYINIDAGTMSPFEHGECYVLDDGGETDLDLGCYERFLNISLKRENSITTGKIYKELLENERSGKYLGKTVQIIPHFTDIVKQKIKDVSEEITLIELGGTIGDIESLPFTETLRQFAYEHKNEVCFVHVSLVPFLDTTNEEKTKPTQESVQKLRSFGISPDILVVRGKTLSIETQKKLSFFCQIPESNIFLNPDLPSIYEVPQSFLDQKMLDAVCNNLKLEPRQEVDLSWWNSTTKIQKSVRYNIENIPKIKIAIVGKYTGLKDSYISIIRALEHASFINKVGVQLIWVNEDLGQLSDVDGILVPGGFGQRGIENMITASKYARENKIPYFGICLGMQVLCIDVARNLLGMDNANSTEFNDKTPHPVVIYQDEISRDTLGGNMRLGLKEVEVDVNSIAFQCYEKELIKERFRHRYVFNTKYDELYIEKMFVNKDIMELRNHPFCIGVQFHPEFLSRHETGHPLFVEFLKRCC